MASYLIGNTPRVEAAFFNVNNVPADPSAVTLLVWKPDGTSTTYGSPIHDGGVDSGTYHQDLLPLDQTGIWKYRWTGTGALNAKIEGFFTIDPTILVGGNPSPLDLATLQDVKDWLNFSAPPAPTQINTGDRIIQRLITACSTLMLTGMNRSFWKKAAIDEIRNGSGTQRMALRYWPVGTVHSLKINNATIPASLDGMQYGHITDGYNLMLVGGGSYFSSDQSGFGQAFGTNAFFKGYQNVRINYDSGWDAPPADIGQACIELVAQRWARRDHIDMDSLVAAPGQSTQYLKLSMPREVKEVIRRYTLIGISEV